MGMNDGLRSRRRDDIDRLRGAAVFAMFFVHTQTAWLGREWRTGRYADFIDSMGGMVAPTFVTLAGIGAVLAGRKAASSGDRSVRRGLCLRGLQIAALGFALNALFFALSGFRAPVERLWRADILPCIGLGLMVFPWICWPLGGKSGRWLCLAMFFALPLAALAMIWVGIEDLLPAPLAAQLSVTSGNGAFPLVPYSAWMVLGLFLGSLWPAPDASRQVEVRFFVGLGAAGLACYGAGMVLAWVFQSFDLFAPGGVRPGRGMLHGFVHKASFVLGLLVAARLSTWLLPSRAWGALRLWGRTSLFAYCAHLVVIYHAGGQRLGGALSPTAVVLWTMFLAALMYLLCLAWSKRSSWQALVRAKA